jgi:hypothetical protein
MPELLTKHPEVAMQLIERAGRRCGPGQRQSILKDCPPERFCTVPGGELCVYGLEQAHSMKKITATDFATLCKSTKRMGSCSSAAATLDLGLPGWLAAAALALAVWARRR